MTEVEKEIEEVENRLEELNMIRSLNKLVSFFDNEKSNKRKVSAIFFDTNKKEFSVFFDNKELEENDIT